MIGDYGWYRDIVEVFSDIGIFYQNEAIACRPLPIRAFQLRCWERDLPTLLDLARRVTHEHRALFIRPESRALVESVLDRPYSEGIMRPDGILCNDQLKILELNVDSSLGGVWEVNHLQTAMNAHYGREEQHVLISVRDIFVNFFSRLKARHFPEKESINVVYVIHHDLERYFKDMILGICKWVNQSPLGVTAAMAPPETLWPADGWITDGSTRYHVAYRYGVLLYELERIRPMIRFLESALDTQTLVLSDHKDLLVEQKGALALLHAFANEDRCTAKERELIQRYIPWTRLLSQERVEFAGEVDAATTIAKRHRDRLVLKRTHSHVGEYVFIGSEIRAEDWEDLVTKAARDDQPWVIQQKLESVAHKFEYVDPETDECRTVARRFTVSPYVYDGAIAGFLCRVENNPDRRVLSTPTSSEMGIASVLVEKDTAAAVERDKDAGL